MTPRRFVLPLLACCLFAAAPAMAQGPRPAPSPPGQAPGAASALVDLEASAGHVLVMGPHVTFQTPKGAFTIVTFPQEAPRTVERVLTLVRDGFYDGLAVHHVEPGFVLQAGDPATRHLAVTDPKVGHGGSGKRLPPEFESQTLHFLAGTVAMARGNDPDSGDSQFFVTLEPQPTLDGAYTVWGQVVTGMDVVRKLQPGDRLTKVTVAK